MGSNHSIFLSFFPLNRQNFQFLAYRRPFAQGDKRADYPNFSKHSLPIEMSVDDPDGDRYDYWVALSEQQDSEEVLCHPHSNRNLTYQHLHNLLRSRCIHELAQHEYELPDQERFRRLRINFVLERHSEGNRIVWLEPYFLVSNQQYGFLVDFEFSAPRGTRSNRRIQRLSLSLDARGLSNRNFYADRYGYIRKFVADFGERLFALTDALLVLPQRCFVETSLLESKQYIFGNGRKSASQFMGLLHGIPVTGVAHNIRTHFFFLERDRWLSRNLYSALSGDSHREKFPGMKKMFGVDFSANSVSGTAVARFDIEHVTRAISDARQHYSDTPFLPVVISPFDKNGTDETNRLYYAIKHYCLRLQLASQFVSVPLLSHEGVFRFAISNIGLQMFAKMGGEPWVVRPETPECLVVGIGQAHRRRERLIEKYFAYSILTEASGNYKRLKILGNAYDFRAYAQDLRYNLRQVLREYGAAYDTVVIHTSFRLRRKELDIISDVLSSMVSETSGRKKFVVMKFNDRNRYFAYSSVHNSMTPYESTCVRLSMNEYLVWFRGLQYHNRTLARRVERPLHIEFLYSSSALTEESRRSLLQDALNMSGANWRGFNAKSLPVSMFYAHLVARFYRGFQTHNLEEVDFETIRPWFL